MRQASVMAPWSRLAWPSLALGVLLTLAIANLAQRQWIYADNAYAPWLLGVAVLLLVYRASAVDWNVRVSGISTAVASVLLTAGAAAFAVGFSQQVELVTMTGCILLLAGTIAWLGGTPALRQLRFPLVFWCLSLPYPGWLVDRLTSPMKLWISHGSEWLLYAWGYPVARSGVVLAIGPYRLLVADACSGLNSLIFLTALGLLYLHLTGLRPAWQRVVMTLSLLPIAVLANGMRVVILLLVTYHLGNDVGQSYWHELAGLLLYATGFAALLSLDALLGWVRPLVGAQPSFGLQGHEVRPHHRALYSTQASDSPGRWRSLSLTGLLACVGLGAYLLTPTHLQAEQDPMPNLDTWVPTTLGHWTHDTQADVLMVSPDTQASVQKLYSQTLARTYKDPKGNRIMLSIAYGGRQMGDDLQAHRPEYCYQAQGFDLLNSRDTILPLHRALTVRQLVAVRHERIEPITYWMTIGDQPTLPGWRRKWSQMQHGLSGQVPDGVLVRVSSVGPQLDHAFAVQADFVAALAQAGLGRLGL